MAWGVSVDFSKESVQTASSVGGGPVFWGVKRGFDLFGALLLLPLTVLLICLLYLLNPVLNPGPVLFSQVRMGRGCKPFRVWKFRSMREVSQIVRQTGDPPEQDRMTPFGKLLRKTRLDELPQVFNVLRGDMSLIGPRPDYIHHARDYLDKIPEYRRRHDVRPGISGYAQVHLGYAVGLEATREKVRADLHYIEHAGFSLEAQLVLDTIRTVAMTAGV